MNQIIETNSIKYDLHLIKIKDACLLLNVKESWLRRQIFLKTIPFKKIGRLIRFEKEELIKWVNQNHA
jgi:excisionase family DNA binding protein